MSRSGRIFFLVLVVASGAVIYAPGLNGAYFADDFKFVFDQPSLKIFHFFFHHNPHSVFYRPLDAMILATVQSLWGMNTFPIHALVLLCHIVLSYLLFTAAIRLRFSKLQGALAALFMLTAQANALAVLSNDALSQVAGTLFGFVSLWHFHRFLFPANEEPANAGIRPARRYVGSLLSFCLALWFKESSLSFLPGILLLGLLRLLYRDEETPGKRFLPLLPFVVVAVMYVVLRSMVVTGEADDRYTLTIGANVLSNVALFLYCAFAPISTVSLFTEFSGGQLGVVVAVSVLTVGVIGIVCLGVFRSGAPRIAALLALIVLFNMFPMAMFEHVSELYIYNAMPALSLLFGLGVGTVGERMSTTKRRTVFAPLIVLLFAAQVFSIHQKAHLMVENGEKASRLIQEIVPYVSRVPPNGTLVLLNRGNEQPEYSVFLMNGFNVLKYGTNILCELSHRRDIQVWIMEERDRPKFPIPSPSVVLIQVGDAVQMEQ